jgi:hypothetical protein
MTNSTFGRPNPGPISPQNIQSFIIQQSFLAKSFKTQAGQPEAMDLFEAFRFSGFDKPEKPAPKPESRQRFLHPVFPIFCL